MPFRASQKHSAVNGDESQLLATADGICDSMKLEKIALDHPHPDSADDEEQHTCSRHDVEPDEQKQLTSGGGEGQRSQRIHLYCNSMKNFNELYD